MYRQLIYLNITMAPLCSQYGIFEIFGTVLDPLRLNPLLSLRFLDKFSLLQLRR
ncbi:hypothetical protein SAMN02746098_03734 [Desulfosporosinus lacus DSM 15449]|uniref:Uncharacterized protein n=1 Tax=Desulfosporosinus lacus DSM 15449 TaxID=1121420 RepID=A0A1M5ZV57_9FIRM|nr:hypothetical protein SAMN02746098_03734 [Desulfosporosinus lacus DSM 15449]